MADARTTLKVDPRTEFGSRTARRMRREGLVPGVVYSGGSEATAFQVSERDVRSVIAEGAALFDISVDGGKARPVVIKEQQLHPVRGTLRHIDLQEVKLDEAIQADVASGSSREAASKARCSSRICSRSSFFVIPKSRKATRPSSIRM